MSFSCHVPQKNKAPTVHPWGPLLCVHLSRTCFLFSFVVRFNAFTSTLADEELSMVNSTTPAVVSVVVRNIVVLAMLLCWTGYAMAATADDPDRKRIMTCSNWYNSWNETEKIMFLVGWAEGVIAADKMTGNVLLERLWPKGHRVG